MLKVHGVKVEYYGIELATLDFEFARGVTLLLGEVGSFKTTLFRIIGGIKEIKEGEIILDEINIEENPPKLRDMAYVGEDSTPSGSVRKALMMPLKLRGVGRHEAKLRADEAARQFGLEPKRKIKELCKRELVAFFAARLSLRETKVTMFDEPYHFFGEENEERITELIKSRGGYTLVSSCDGGDVERLKPDYLFVLRGDKTLVCGKTEDVLSAQNDRYVSLFLGTESRDINVL